MENGEDIVISGVSGRFPNSRNLDQLSYNLFNKIDMVDEKETRWRHTNPEVPRRMGKTLDIEKFDASFFGVNYRHARTMDPQGRIILEHAFESILDAGISPKTLKGKNVGVFIGASYNESEMKWIYEKFSKDGLGIVGSARAMLANRISFSLGFIGPSFTLDTACSSSMYALDIAYKLLKSGEIEAALVGGSNLCLHPHIMLQFIRLGVVSKDGYCRPFDKNASGYTRAEASCIFFLQKRKNAKRVYATVLHSKTNCDGFKEEGINFPSHHLQAQLMKTFYEEVGIAPNDSNIGYFEAHCTGTKVGDPEECRAIEEVMCKGRKGPLLVGSVKSNMGHAEPGAGVCSMSKILLALEHGKIPPNINITEIKPEIAGIMENKMKVVQEVTDLKGTMISCNSFGFGGANAHALFKANQKLKVNRGIPKDKVPRIVTWSGRTEEAIKAVMDSVTKQPLDAEYIGLLHNSQRESINANLYKGYGIFKQGNDTENATCVRNETQHFSGFKRPMVWVYTGMGSQWCQMGVHLMKIPMFAESIERSHKLLADRGLNLKQIITSPDPKIFDNILNSFVGIAAIQVALTDILKALELTPDHIIGHSVGELGCAYADGCFTAEETIISAYSRGLVSHETKVIHGSMAAVGLGYAQLKDIVPEGIEIACHNSSESSTISGPADKIAAFVESLKEKKIFAKEVECSHIPYHSSYIKDMGPILYKRLKEVIKTNKKRSSKWITSSVPASQQHIEYYQSSSAEYQINNLVNPVLFEETLAQLPKNAILIEISPHGLLQAILKRSMVESINIPLTQRGNSNNDEFFMSALGKIFCNGFDINVSALYPAVEFPVSRGTPMISPNIKWDHSDDHYVMRFDDKDDGKSSSRKVTVSLSELEYEFIQGHCIDGRCIFPATGYLFLAWETLAMMKGLLYFDISVEFEDVKFHRATSMSKESDVEFTIVVHPGTGRFEISEGTSSLVTGMITEVDNPKMKDIKGSVDISSKSLLSSKDFYKELRLRGYHYNDLFRSVTEGSFDGTYGKIIWDSNWIAFLDCLLQLKIIGRDTRSLVLPTGIQKMTINTKKHLEILTKFEDGVQPVYEAFINPELKAISCGGVEIVNMQASVVGRRKPPGIPVLETYEFIPYNSPKTILSMNDACRVISQLYIENNPSTIVKVVEIDGNDDKNMILEDMLDALSDLPLITTDLKYLSSRTIEQSDDIKVLNETIDDHEDCGIIIASNGDSSYSNKLSNGGFLVIRGEYQSNDKKLKKISTIRTETEVLSIFQKTRDENEKEPEIYFISEKDSELKWIKDVQALIQKGPLVLVTENEPTSGLIGLVNCLRREPGGTSIRCVFIDDRKASKFDLKHPIYRDQLELGLAINVYRSKSWGSFRHLKINPVYVEKPALGHCYGNSLVKSDLSSLKWLQGPLELSDENIVRVHYASLNFKDVMLATGKISADVFVESRIGQECVLGFEYSGIDRNNKRLMGLIKAGSLASYISKDPLLSWDIPNNWTLEQAATVPCVYGTVYYAFFIIAQIKRGRTILIHAGTGGIGLAAIRVAFAYGLDVFTTVSTEEKTNFLLKEFPKLKRENIGNSRDTSFEDMIMNRTSGKGVDYVLNSLAEEKLHASIRCLGKGGKFLEIGKFDMEKGTKIGMECFLNEISIHSVMLDKIMIGSDADKMVLRKILENDIHAGIIKPFKTNIFPANQIEQAFRYLASGKHMGKVILQIRERESDNSTLPITVLPRVYCHPYFTYIISGGLGGFGLELADWLVLRGCRKLVLSSSRGITKPYQAYRIKTWESYGVRVVVNTSNILTEAGCEKLILDSRVLGPVGGIFNLAVVLRDSIFENQDATKFNESMAPKAVATKYLDEISRVLCPELQYFVVFSSVSCGRGNAGQSNYGMANSVMERVMEQRHGLGLPAKAIQWGAVGEVGLVADMQEDLLDMEIGGTLQQRISSCLEELDTLLTVKQPIVASMVVAEKRYASSKSGNVFEVILNIMGIRDAKSVSMETTLAELGMDSLMLVEIQQTLEREYNFVITAQDLRSMTLTKLIESVGSKSVAENGKEEVGVNILIRNLGNEANSKETLICLSEKKNTNRLNLFFPGVEGCGGDVWKLIANRMTGSSFMFQHKNVTKVSSVNEFVNEIYSKVSNLFNQFADIRLIGYSFGSIIVLKLADMLEQQNKVPKVTLIDGSPIFLNTLVRDHLVTNNFEDIIETLILKTVVEGTARGENSKVIHILQSNLSLVEKISALVNEIDGLKIYSESHIAEMIKVILDRSRLIYNLNINDFNSLNKVKIKLIRPQSSALKNLENDYGLTRYSTQPIDVKFVNGDHLSMLDTDDFRNILSEDL